MIPRTVQELLCNKDNQKHTNPRTDTAINNTNRTIYVVMSQQGWNTVRCTQCVESICVRRQTITWHRRQAEMTSSTSCDCVTWSRGQTLTVMASTFRRCETSLGSTSAKWTASHQLPPRVVHITQHSLPFSYLISEPHRSSCHVEWSKYLGIFADCHPSPA